MDWNNVIEKLRRDGERMNSSSKEIGRMLRQVALLLDDVLPEGFDSYRYAELVWKRYGRKSNVGYLGPSFWYEGELVSSEKAPGGYYLHNDFNAWIEVAGPLAKREAAKLLPELVLHLAEEISERAKEQEEAVEIVEKLLNAIKGGAR